LFAEGYLFGDNLLWEMHYWEHANYLSQFASTSWKTFCFTLSKWTKLWYQTAAEALAWKRSCLFSDPMSA